MHFNRKFTSFLVSLLIIFSCSTIHAEKLSMPQINGSSSVLIEAQSGRILYSNNPNKKLPIASTTKIMTALIALEHGRLDEKVKIKGNSVGIEGSSIYLFNGEEISLRDLVYGLMLRSGNDAAVAIANHISGSVEEFAKLMNEKALEIGAKNTNFTNPHGLHDDNHYSTAYDLAIITREAMKNEEFKKISKSKLYVADREINKYFYNKNKTLNQYDGGDGVKIGYTKKAGRCLVSSATREYVQLIAVVLNNYTWFNDCYKLFDYGFENYKPMVIYDKNQFIKNINVMNGKKDLLPIITKDELILPLTEDEKKEIKTTIKLPDEFRAPVNKGDSIGNVKVFLKGQLIFTGELIARENIKEKGIIDKALDFFQKKFK